MKNFRPQVQHSGDDINPISSISWQSLLRDVLSFSRASILPLFFGHGSVTLPIAEYHRRNKIKHIRIVYLQTACTFVQKLENQTNLPQNRKITKQKNVTDFI